MNSYFCITSRPQVPPSGDKHDYYTLAPDFWPNPNTTDGLPYVRKYGRRLAGTELFDAESDKYDRSRMASLFSNTTCLALAWYASAALFWHGIACAYECAYACASACDMCACAFAFARAHVCMDVCVYIRCAREVMGGWGEQVHN